MANVRLIDANALKATYEKWLPQLENQEDEGDKNGVITCIAVLEDAPTIEAEPVRHGRWYDKKWDEHPHMHSWRCSVCEYTVSVNPISPNYKYCPNCGAKMNGGTENE